MVVAVEGEVVVAAVVLPVGEGFWCCCCLNLATFLLRMSSRLDSSWALQVVHSSSYLWGAGRAHGEIISVLTVFL